MAILASTCTRGKVRSTSSLRAERSSSGGIHTEPERVAAVLGSRARARILIEASTDSEWVARCREALGHEVIVADPNFALPAAPASDNGRLRPLDAAHGWGDRRGRGLMLTTLRVYRTSRGGLTGSLSHRRFPRAQTPSTIISL